ncbi:MAG: periplasmic heavy metal sensor [Steroidobacteraceae bacterium]
MTTPTETRATPDRLKLALSLSVVLNLFLLGVIAGHFLSHRVGSPALAVGGTLMTRAVARAEAALDPADAAAFRAVLARDRPRFAESAEQVGAARRELARQIAANPFNPRAATQALAAWRTSWDRFMDDFSGPLIDALTSISPQGRQRLEMRDKRFEDGQRAANQRPP